MIAPKLPSMFRNVRRSPRRFNFRSRHLPVLNADWQERKQRVESLVSGTSEVKRAIRFARSGEGRQSWKERQGALSRASRRTTFRLLILIGALSWVAVKALQWVDYHDFGGMLEALKNG